jgi:hypothetical protein
MGAKKVPRWTDTYEARSDEQIKELAVGLMGGAVYTDFDVFRAGGDLALTFMPLAFMEDDDRKSLVDFLLPDPEHMETFGMMYEWLDKAGPRHVNGQPMFFSIQVLSPEDRERVMAVIDRLRAVLAPVEEGEREKHGL